MPSKQTILKRNKTKRLRKDKMRRTLFQIRNVIISILVLIIVFCGVVFLAHNINTKKEIELLKEEGMYNLVDVPLNKKMNVAIYGNKESKHTIVPISDIGVQNYSTFVKHIASPLKDSTKVALIDRVGHGMSKDTSEKQMIDKIIIDYRNALSNVGLKPPYILMAHEFGGVYATHWASLYPEEIEGIVYLDGTPMNDETIELKEGEKSSPFNSLLSKLGFQRLYYHNYYAYAPKSLTKVEASTSKAFNIHSVETMAGRSEESLMKSNYERAKAKMKSTKIPKLYISSRNGFQNEKQVIEYFEYVNQQNKELKLEPYYNFKNDEQTKRDIDKFLKERKEAFEKETKPYVNALGNCQITTIGGYERIYEHNPEGVSNALVDFLKYISGEIKEIKPMYDNSTAVNWEKYDKEKKEKELEKQKELERQQQE